MTQQDANSEFLARLRAAVEAVSTIVRCETIPNRKTRYFTLDSSQTEALLGVMQALGSTDVVKLGSAPSSIGNPVALATLRLAVDDIVQITTRGRSGWATMNFSLPNKFCHAGESILRSVGMWAATNDGDPLSQADKAGENRETQSVAVADDSVLCPTKLAELFEVSADALRARLNKWRQGHHDGWIEITDRKPREAKYLYCVGAVRHIIDDLKTKTSQTTRQRPAKKN